MLSEEMHCFPCSGVKYHKQYQCMEEHAGRKAWYKCRSRELLVTFNTYRENGESRMWDEIHYKASPSNILTSPRLHFISILSLPQRDHQLEIKYINTGGHEGHIFYSDDHR